jgi:hypothetical protein
MDVRKLAGDERWPVDEETVVRALLGVIDGRVVVHPYADSLLVDLPLTYSDGDSVRLLVEPLGSEARVSDRASAFERLILADVNTDTGRVAEAISATIRAAGLSNIGGEEDEIATFGPVEDLGGMVIAVAQAALKAEQLR